MKVLNFIRSVCFLFIAAFFLQACGEDPFRPDFSQIPDPFDRSEAVRDSLLPQGVHIFIIEEGEGLFEVTFKDQILVKYTGRTEDNEVFVSSYVRRSEADSNFVATLENLYPYPIRSPFTGRPTNPLIEGFRKGLYGMVAGEKRSIVVPSEMGANRQTRSGVNLEGKTLIFDVELIQIIGIPQDKQ